MPYDKEYVDGTRLDSYVSQIRSPMTQDKSPSWKVTFSLTGPKVEASQISHLREMTEEEKIKAVEDHLHKHNLVADGRIVDHGDFHRDEVRPFRSETCQATKIWIPPAAPKDVAAEKLELEPVSIKDFGRHRRLLEEARREEKANTELAKVKGLTMWFSRDVVGDDENTRRIYDLFLLLDLANPDEPPALHSSYSALLFIYEEARPELKRTVLEAFDGQINNPVSAIEKSFINDPLRALLDIGARVITNRKIRTLYRVRTVRPGTAWGYTTVAYPLFIFAD